MVEGRARRGLADGGRPYTVFAALTRAASPRARRPRRGRRHRRPGPAGRHRPRHGRPWSMPTSCSPRRTTPAATPPGPSSIWPTPARSSARWACTPPCWPGSTPPRCGPASPSTTSTGPNCCFRRAPGVCAACSRPASPWPRGDDDQAWARLVGGDAVRLPLRLCIEREVVLACASACRPAGRVPHRPGAGAG